MNALTQDTRLGRLTTVLGKDVLNLLRFTGSDHVNDLFEYRVEALSTQPNIDFDGLIGTHASVEIESQNDGTRTFDGIVTEAQWSGVGENGNKYELTLRPWLWLASRRRNQRIFHKQTVVQIIETLFGPYSGLGKPALKVNLANTYPDLEYTVQYRESDMAFAQRLMERFGISYHFAHEVGSHSLVLTDAVENYPTVAGGSREYKPVDGARQANTEHFWEWYAGRRLTTGAVRLTDYNFKTPTAAMEVDRIGDASYEQGQIESFDYPGDYLAQGVGKGVVGLRTDAERGQDMRHRATGDCTSLGAGMLVTLTGDQVPGVKDTKYLCLSATHSYISDAYGSGDATSDGYAYSGNYVLMPDTAPLAPERKTHIPVVQGPQTAVVVGEGEIDCDEYGRILVHFHWDLEKAYSMRCRVSQNWASKGWGGMVIPRIGMEVVVEFLEGDPDKPLVTGCVYNGQNDVPYPLPEHKTVSTFKTDTHKGNGFNELRFEDERGQQEIFMHAERDFNRVVRRDDLENVGRSKYTEVRRKLMVSVGGNSVHESRGVAEISGGRGVSIQGGPSGLSPKFFEAAMASHQMIFDRQKFSLLSMASAVASGGVTITADTATVDQAGLTRLNFTGVASQTVVGKDKFTHVGKLHQLISGGTTVIASADNTAVEAGERIDIVCGKSAIHLHADGTIELVGVHIKAVADNIDLN